MIFFEKLHEKLYSLIDVVSSIKNFTKFFYLHNRKSNGKFHMNIFNQLNMRSANRPQICHSINKLNETKNLCYLLLLEGDFCLLKRFKQTDKYSAKTTMLLIKKGIRDIFFRKYKN
ncbi:hypothetical protein BpHYR1_040843 [Brachionus plicatilis]|uniref:Uncharacterized protein n=1 Tax=Brachionus plicatilis TaxID=10195 RepID=A0A3M7PH01_BRAPC|nr:hypothetical protein BpHYR1_040843 [Brachionus plicatilis]